MDPLAQPPAAPGPVAGGGPGGAGAHEERPTAAWRRLLADQAVARQHRVTAWRVLHGALLVNALRVHVDPRLRAEEGLCSLPACRAAAAQHGPGAGAQPGGAAPWETLTHAFMACPAAAPVLDWAWGLWAALTPGTPQPPRCAAVLLLDRRDCWRPPPWADAAWAALRVTLLGCLWHERCSRTARAGDPGEPGGGALASAFRAAAAVVEHLEHAIRRDWDRASGDVRLMSEDVGSALFSGRDPSLSQEGFLQRWGLQGRLCEVRQDGSLLVRLGLDRPVPVPGLPVD